jgi:hypothetical protein
MLFCNNRVKADSLIRSYSKFKASCFGSWEVVRLIKLWDKEDETSLLVFEVEGIENINRHYSNILAMTDRKNILMVPNAKEQFEVYV